QSIRFGEHEDLTAEARRRVADLHERGMTEARLYGANPKDGVGGTGSVFLLLDEPEVYGLPPDPQVPTTSLPASYAKVGIAAAGRVAAAALAVRGGRRCASANSTPTGRRPPRAGAAAAAAVDVAVSPRSGWATARARVRSSRTSRSSVRASSTPTTAAPSSRRRRGASRSRSTSSSAGWRAVPVCSPSGRSSPRARRCVAARGWWRSGPWGRAPSP